jgi:hypothetical protein
MDKKQDRARQALDVLVEAAGRARAEGDVTLLTVAKAVVLAILDAAEALREVADAIRAGKGLA